MFNCVPVSSEVVVRVPVSSGVLQCQAHQSCVVCRDLSLWKFHSSNPLVRMGEGRKGKKKSGIIDLLNLAPPVLNPSLLCEVYSTITCSTVHAQYQHLVHGTQAVV